MPFTLSSNLRPRVRRHWWALFVALLTVTIAIAYAQVFRMGFTTDDYIEVGARHFDALDSLASQNYGVWFSRFAERSFVDPVTDWPIFRPVRQWLFWSDYLMWQMAPAGYHLTNLILHLLTSFVVGLIAWRMTRDIKAPFFAGLLFAAQSIHAGPVAAISSRGHVMAGLFVAMSILFYILPRKPLTVVLSMLGYILALGSKETAIMLPVILLLYDGISGQLRRNRIREAIKRQIPFWMIVGAYFLARQLATGGVANSPIPLGQLNWPVQLEAYSGFLLDPFLNGLNLNATIPAIAACVLAVSLYGSRPLIWFGLLWVPVSLLLTVNFFPQDRYYYTPSIGPALVLASILTNPIPAPPGLLQALPALRHQIRDIEHAFAGLKTSLGFLQDKATALLGLAVVLFLVANYCLASYSLISDYVRAGQATRRFLHQVYLAFPSFPANSQIYFLGLPRMVGRGYAFSNSRQVQYALQLEYGDRSLQASMVDHFPYIVQDLQKTFFLEYDRGKITERSDLLQAISVRKSCPPTLGGAVTWDFAFGAQGWEPWNQISDWQVQNGALSLTTTGSDPNIASPVIEIPWRQLGRIDVTMTAQAAKLPLTAKLFWQSSEMDDFSPGYKKEFTVQADGKPHLYQIELSTIPTKNADIPLVRLRFDPADSPAEIRISSIRIECR